MKYFPKNGTGIVLTIIKQLKICVVPKFEFVFKKGEVASEMYFIIDGKAEVLAGNGIVTEVLSKQDYFGQMGVIFGKSTIRNVI